jgi:hypothetical protein
MTLMIPHELFCERVKYIQHAKAHIKRELEARGIKGWIVDEAVGRFEKEKLTEIEIIEMYLKR